jgi:hypothetical protein
MEKAKQAIEEFFGLEPATTPAIEATMNHIGSRLRDLERKVGLRDDPPSNNGDQHQQSQSFHIKGPQFR